MLSIAREDRLEVSEYGVDDDHTISVQAPAAEKTGSMTGHVIKSLHDDRLKAMDMLLLMIAKDSDAGENLVARAFAKEKRIEASPQSFLYSVTDYFPHTADFLHTRAKAPQSVLEELNLADPDPARRIRPSGRSGAGGDGVGGLPGR